MPRKSLQHTVTLEVPRTHESFWELMMMLDQEGSWSLPDVLAGTNARKDTVVDYLRRLTKAGFVEIVDTVELRPGTPKKHVYRIARKQRRAPRVSRDGKVLPEPAQDTIWRVIGMLKDFSAAELHQNVQLDNREIKLGTVKSYLKRLVKAGIVTIQQDRPSAPGQYRLVRRLGGKAPRILRTHNVFDPNSGTMIGPAETEEVTL